MSNSIPNETKKFIPCDPPWVAKRLKTLLNRKNRHFKNYKKHEKSEGSSSLQPTTAYEMYIYNHISMISSPVFLSHTEILAGSVWYVNISLSFFQKRPPMLPPLWHVTILRSQGHLEIKAETLDC